MGRIQPSSVLERLFDLQIVSEGVTELAIRQPFPVQTDIVLTLAAARHAQHCPKPGSGQQPSHGPDDSLFHPSGDLRVSERVWAEFKHANSTAYLRRFDASGQGTEKELIRDTCMDIAHIEAIDSSGHQRGIVIASLLHLDFLDDMRAAGVDRSLQQLAKSMSVDLETRSFPYDPHQKGGVRGALSLYLFHRVFRSAPLRTYHIHPLSQQAADGPVEERADSPDECPPGGQRAVFPGSEVEAVFDGVVPVSY